MEVLQKEPILWRYKLFPPGVIYHAQMYYFMQSV